VTRKAEAQSTLSLLETQKSLAQQSEEMYRLMGDEHMARQARIEQMQIDVKITRAKAEVARAEAQGSIDVAQATLEEMRVKGEIDPVKRAELEASIRLAQAKLKEADAIGKSAQITERAIDNLRAFGDASDDAGQRGSAAGDQVAKSWDDAAASIGRASEAAKNVTKDGWAANESGNAVVTGESQAELNQRVAALFGERNIGNKDAIDAANIKLKLEGAHKYGTLPVMAAYWDAQKKEYERLVAKLQSADADAAQKEKNDKAAAVQKTKEDAAAASKEKDTQRSSASTSTSAAGMAGGLGQPGKTDPWAAHGGVASVIRVELGQRSYPVDTTTDDGRQQLEALLRDLGQARARAA
jgi:hypothetical protein